MRKLQLLRAQLFRLLLKVIQLIRAKNKNLSLGIHPDYGYFLRTPQSCPFRRKPAQNHTITLINIIERAAVPIVFLP
ncbi:MAG: hypothetical protein AB7U05_10770 [Mangrovibacterium sp.]